MPNSATVRGIWLALLAAIVRRTAHFCGMRLQRRRADRN
jgi:hypothetical protein